MSERLLTDEEILGAIESGYEVIDGVEMRVIHAVSIAKAQDAKTASIKDAEFEKKCKECEYDPQADMVGWFLEHGWIPPEERRREIEATEQASTPEEALSEAFANGYNMEARDADKDNKEEEGIK